MNIADLRKDASAAEKARAVAEGSADLSDFQKLASGKKYDIPVMANPEEGTLCLSGDGKFSLDKKSTPSEAHFMNHMVGMITDMSIPEGERLSLHRFINFVHQVRAEFPWWCIYKWYQFIILEMKGYNIHSYSLDPKTHQHAFRSQFARFAGSAHVDIMGGTVSSQTGDSGPPRGGEPGKLCYKYNNAKGNKCQFPGCKFQHQCSNCGGAHPLSKCTKGKQVVKMR